MTREKFLEGHRAFAECMRVIVDQQRISVASMQELQTQHLKLIETLRAVGPRFDVPAAELWAPFDELLAASAAMRDQITANIDALNVALGRS